MKYQKWEHGQGVYLGDNTTRQIYDQGHVYIKLNSSQIKNISNVLHVLRLRKICFQQNNLTKCEGEIRIKNGSMYS
jgi:hypothetical protein